MNLLSEDIVLGTVCRMKCLHILLIITAQGWLYPVGWKPPRACILTVSGT